MAVFAGTTTPVTWDIRQGDCLDLFPAVPDASIDAVITDPPYPEIDRPYGRMSETAWRTMMHAAVKDIRRVLKPTGSAMFVLQPNSERVGKMRAWLWEFQAWLCKEWGIVQDAYWWNYTTIPGIQATHHGLMRSSVKTCVWCGPPDCYRNQAQVLWRVSDYTVKQAMVSADRWKQVTASGHGMNRTAASEAAVARGGSTPYNLLPVSNARGHTSGGGRGHPAATPLALCDWWVRYIVPVGGTILDPFNGAGTMGLAAVKNGSHYIGFERVAEYCAISRQRIRALPSLPLFDASKECS